MARNVFGQILKSVHGILSEEVQLIVKCLFLPQIPYSGNLLREEIFANRAILLSEEIFVIFDFNLLGDF